MQIPQNEIASKEEIGKYKNSRVFLIRTIGGLNICAIASATPEIASVAPHPAVARFLAQKKFPAMELNFQKSEDMPVSAFNSVLPKYEAMTDAIIALQNRKK
jgi:hypothetical protein